MNTNYYINYNLSLTQNHHILIHPTQEITDNEEMGLFDNNKSGSRVYLRKKSLRLQSYMIRLVLVGFGATAYYMYSLRQQDESTLS